MMKIANLIRRLSQNLGQVQILRLTNVKTKQVFNPLRNIQQIRFDSNGSVDISERDCLNMCSVQSTSAQSWRVLAS